MSVAEIMRRAGVCREHEAAIADLPVLLEEHGAIEEHRRAAGKA